MRNMISPSADKDDVLESGLRRQKLGIGGRVGEVYEKPVFS